MTALGMRQLFPNQFREIMQKSRHFIMLEMHISTLLPISTYVIQNLIFAPFSPMLYTSEVSNEIQQYNSKASTVAPVPALSI